MEVTVTPEEVTMFQEKILQFYDENKRIFPWRKTEDPYKIWVSEVMLQQTQANRVVPKYNEWMQEFNTVQSLSEATLQQVLENWDGLGYNNRAKWLRDAARKVVTEYDGELPVETEKLESLKGVGPYTSRAIRIFAHNIDEVTVDTNIRRIFISEFNLSKDLSSDDLYPLAHKVLPQGRSREWHNALMDYGSLEATSRKTGIKPETTQSTFKGSNRWYRSKILKKVREKPRRIETIKELYEEKGMKALRSLEKDGMVRIDHGVIRLPS